MTERPDRTGPFALGERDRKRRKAPATTSSPSKTRSASTSTSKRSASSSVVGHAAPADDRDLRGLGNGYVVPAQEHRSATARRAENGNGTGPAVHVVSFNAWEYSASEVIWPGLVRRRSARSRIDVERPSSGRCLRRNAGRQLKVAPHDHRRPHDPDRRRRSGFRPVPVQHGCLDRRRRCGWSRWGREVRPSTRSPIRSGSGSRRSMTGATAPRSATWRRSSTTSRISRRT